MGWRWCVKDAIQFTIKRNNMRVQQFLNGKSYNKSDEKNVYDAMLCNGWLRNKIMKREKRNDYKSVLEMTDRELGKFLKK